MNERAERMRRLFEIPAAAAALLTIPVLVIEGSSWGQPWRGIGATLNWATWLVFVLELVVMLVVVDDRWRWLRENPLDVVVTILTPPLLPPGLQALRALRLLRLLRLVRVASLARRLFSPTGLRWVAVLALITVLVGAEAFESIEPDRSLWDGIWWAMTTMTTVGYGDVYPVTTEGRVIGIVLMLVGIGVVAVITGAVAERFLAASIEHEDAAIEDIEHDLAGDMAEIRRRLDRIDAHLASR